ncbi:hypothetical protein [Burkholderia stagnalis]|uniref:hypothetical protein n=1 Tax=Burkholderia stagnalis TaxID=1503054 RepID=UPI00325ACDFD
MALTVVFVHGTGVRKASYEFTCSRIAEGIRSVDPMGTLLPCLWGDVHGARLGLNGASIPEFSKEVRKVPDNGQIVALWDLLARDPFFELRELTASTSKGLESPNEKTRKSEFVDILRALDQDPALLESLRGHVLPVQWHETVDAVTTSTALKDALAAVPRIDSTLRLAVARSLVASLQQRLDDENMPPIPTALRDDFVETCRDRLGGGELGGIKDWFTNKLMGLGLRLATKKARRDRDALFSSASPTAGDVLLYQARGSDIRGYIQGVIEKCGDEVIVLAHSLGGIACVDLLIEKHMPQVKLLVTVGSQAPFMYEIGALTCLPFGEPLPPHFPSRWLNFYDCDDLLSYAASKVFPGRAVDYEIRSGQPFPMSHSAYWDAPDLWARLKTEVKS